jgi:hypothetical protein
MNIGYFLLLYYTDIIIIKRYETLRFKQPDYELLVMGNSLACDAFDTGWLSSRGIKSYNLAIPGSSVKTNYVQLEEYLTTYSNKPHYVLLGLGSFTGTFEDETVHPIVEFTGSDVSYGIDDLPMIKFRWLAIEILKKMVSSNHRNIAMSCGQFKFKKVQPDQTQYGNNTFNYDRYRNALYIKKMALLCKANDVELILVEMPGFKEVQNEDRIGPYGIDYEEGASATLYNLNNVEFGRFFDANKHWIGNSHLNEFGAQQFTWQLYKIVFSPNKAG